jgi:hypothetical protein
LTTIHPPKPRLTLRVGITGHRPNKLHGTAVERIERQLPLVFAAIDAAAGEILTANSDFYAQEPSAIRLVSGLAEGADQMAVAACPRSWQIEAILPFPKDEYLNDFAKSAAVHGRDVRSEFEESLHKATVVTQLAFVPSGSGDKRTHRDRDLGKRDRGYAEAGSYLLRQIDVLIAVWDGEAPKMGGTGVIAKHAFEGGIPVVWLSTRDDHVPRLVKGFDESGDPIAPDTDCTNGPLATVLHSLFDAPSQLARNSRGSASAGLDNFYREGWRQCCYFPVYDILERSANRERLRYVIGLQPFEDRCRDWDKFIADAPEVTDLRERLRHVLVPRYVWADSLAIYFSHQYRSAYVIAYGLSSLAVFIALGGLFVDSVNVKAVFVLLELLVIGTIILMIQYGRRWRWHERWLDYRALAESLRHVRFLAYVSEFGRIHDGSVEPSGRSPSWMLWYLRATMREIGLPTATLDATYQWRILNASLRHEPEDQIEYHRTNSIRAHQIDHLLHRIGVVCFSITFAILSVFLIGYIFEYVLTHIMASIQSPITTFLISALAFLKGKMIFFSAGLPALGAALAGIRVHGDFEGSREHSEHMVEALASVERDYLAALDRETGFEETAKLLISTARIMSEDVVAWQQLYGRKRLSLPA